VVPQTIWTDEKANRIPVSTEDPGHPTDTTLSYSHSQCPLGYTFKVFHYTNNICWHELYMSNTILHVHCNRANYLRTNYSSNSDEYSAKFCGSLSPRHDASSGFEWRMRPPDNKVAANILNKQSRTAEKWWSSSVSVGRGANNSSP